jgi:hypothetical protein
VYLPRVCVLVLTVPDELPCVVAVGLPPPRQQPSYTLWVPDARTAVGT